MTMLVVCIVLMPMALATVMQPPTVIMTSPDSVIKSYGQSFTIECAGTGVNTPELTWYKDGTMVNSGGKLTVKDGVINVDKNWFTNLEGKYQCKAENNYGLSQSNLVVVKQAYLNQFSAPPSTITPKVVNEGSPLKLECLYTEPFSFPTAVWNWHVHNSITEVNVQERSLTIDGRLGIDDRGNLYFQHVLPSDNQENWYYVCGAWNTVMNTKRYGSPNRLNVQAVANVPSTGPTLVYTNGVGASNLDKTVEVMEGDDVELYCIFEGYPLVTVEWQKLGTTEKPFFEYENGQVRLVLKNVENTEKFEGQYECTGRQTGRSQTATGRFTVSVLQKPKFIEGPVNTNVTEGGEVNFTCRASADPPASIEWFVNGKSVNSLPFDARRTVDGNTFKIKNLRKGSNPQNSDLQVVSCMAKNTQNTQEIGRSYKDGYINVLLAMKFIVKPSDFTVTDNDKDVILNCSISTDPSLTPTITWHYKKYPIVTTKDKYLITSDKLIIYTQKFDQLADVLGDYTCVGETKNPDQIIQHTAQVKADSTVMPVAASINPWWIGIILAILLLVLIGVLIYCCCKQRKYDHNVDKMERKWGNDPEKDLQKDGFQEYGPKQKPPISGSRTSLDFNGIALAEMENVDDLTPAHADRGMTNVGYDEEPDHDSLNQYGQDSNPGVNPGFAPGPDDYYGHQNRSYQPDV